MEDDEAEPKMGLRVDPELDYDEDLYQLSTGDRRGPAAQSRARRSRRRIVDDDDEQGIS